ncbi:hypothetical protein C8Q76DRAFT_721168 [Earliella scabrosa]|nr:hypothetical protein C8Q76DRAFT_721168 [Earliella scabrosa]
MQRYDSIPRDSFLNYQAALKKKWADVAKNDPRRKTVEGDEFSEIPLLFEELGTLSKQSTSKTWKGLVNAGIITALCKFALNSTGFITYAPFTRKEDGTLELSEESIKWAADHAPSPFFPAISLICNAAVSCAIPPTSTEIKMIEELKKQWSTLMQKFWSDPAQSLEAENPSRVRERAVVAQIIHLLAHVDPFFLEPIFKPADLTLPVIFRNWLYATAEYDSEVNATFLAPLLDNDESRDWKDWTPYMKEHPLPDIGTRLQRILLGATKGPDKKKRTPNQAAEFIVSSFARHFRTSKGLNLGRNLELFSRLLAASEGQNIQIFRATYKSEALWTSLMQILKRNALNSSGPPRMTSLAMHEAMSVLHLSHTIRYKPEYQEHVDILIYNWLTAGLFDALDAVLPAIMNSTTGPMFVSFILTMIHMNLPKLSTKTREKLRSELPRSRLQGAFMIRANMGSLDPRQLFAIWEGRAKIECPFELHDPRHPMWAQGAWQSLMKITFSVRPWRATCSRRGCEKSGDVGSCKSCGVTPYCSAECLHNDDEHRFICRWASVLCFVHLYQQRGEEAEEKLIAHGVVSPKKNILPIEDELERMRAAGAMTDDEVAQFKEAINKLRGDRPEEAGLEQLQEALESASLSESSTTEP